MVGTLVASLREPFERRGRQPNLWSLGLLVSALSACSVGPKGSGGAGTGNGGSGTADGAATTGTSVTGSANAMGAAGAAMSSTEVEFADVTIAESGSEMTTTCAAEVRAAENIPLDIYVMLDISSSMLDSTPAGEIKWDAVRQSLQDFVLDESSGGIGIGIQYFPQIEPGTPADLTCTTNDDCGGAAGPCNNSFCVTPSWIELDGDRVDFFLGPVADPQFCLESSECGTPGDICQRANGFCASPDGILSAGEEDAPRPLTCEYQADCPLDSRCELPGICNQIPSFCTATLGCAPDAGECLGLPYSCVNGTKCDLADYAAPAVAISNGDTRNADIVDSLTAQEPLGLTPTGPALGGALRYAQEWAGEHPAHQVVTVLATDGFPTECSPLEAVDIEAIAGQGLGASPSIKTFVIGVFSELDLADGGEQRLDDLAQAGGSDGAFIIDTESDVATQFAQALNDIRSTAASCEFQLPEVDPANPLDYAQVNLRYTDGTGSAKQLFNVADAAACTAADAEGWYYEFDAETDEPRQITVCPGVCAAFEGEGGGQIELEIGCATIVR